MLLRHFPSLQSIYFYEYNEERDDRQSPLETHALELIHSIVTPAEAGVQTNLDSRLRGNDAAGVIAAG